MNLFDWIALALVALLAIAGYFRGLLTAALSLAGIVGGALLGARLAPYFLSGGSSSRYATLFALGGAIFCAVVLEAFGSFLGGMISLLVISQFDGAWQALFWFGAIVSAVATIVMWLTLPESPAFLVRQGTAASVGRIAVIARRMKLTGVDPAAPAPANEPTD